MFEVIYITNTFKSAVNFIEKLAEGLKKSGIDNIELNLKSIRLKSDKFIVSTMPIYSSMLGRSKQMVKYFIDDVSTEHCETVEQRKLVLERMDYIKMGFRKGTREIKREELLDILIKESEG